jgi:hypothetical protein
VRQQNTRREAKYISGNKDSVHGCQIGTRCPILHAKQDRPYPTGFSDDALQRAMSMRGRTIEDEAKRTKAVWGSLSHACASVAAAGMMVWYGRFPGARQFGCAGSSMKLAPRFCRAQPLHVSGWQCSSTEQASGVSLVAGASTPSRTHQESRDTWRVLQWENACQS